MTEIDWEKVAYYLKNDAAGIRERAMSAFPNDFTVQQEMRTRSCILESLAAAIEFGLR